MKLATFILALAVGQINLGGELANTLPLILFALSIALVQKLEQESAT
jgi:hypothetical protein